MGKVTLEAMLRRASRMAEKALEEDGEVTAFWLVETLDGEQFTILTPMAFPEGMEEAAGKEMLARCLREDFKANGVVRYVGVLEVWHAPDRQPPPTTRELPDDVGRVFVTNVPGSLLQVIGRRNPATGVLHAGRTTTLEPGTDWGKEIVETMERTGVRVEVVTGKEAEDLINSIVEPKDHPLREEAVLLSAGDGERSVMGMRKVVRPVGRSPYLGPLQIEEQVPSQGRFVNMLADVPAVQ
jgi:hypothetical protein